MTSPLEPIGSNVVVEPIEQHRQSTGGVLMPETSLAPTEKGRVVAVGSGHVMQSGERVPFELAVGDVVYFSRSAGGRCEVDGVTYRVMHEREVFCRAPRARVYES